MTGESKSILVSGPFDTKVYPEYVDNKKEDKGGIWTNIIIKAAADAAVVQVLSGKLGGVCKDIREGATPTRNQ